MLSPCGKYFASGEAGASDNTLKVWEIATGAELRRIQVAKCRSYSGKMVKGVSFEEGGKILTSSEDGTIKLRTWPQRADRP